MCWKRLAGNTLTGPKDSPKNRHLGSIAQLCRAISSQLRHVSTIGKKLLSSNIFSTCSHNMVNFGPLPVEIDPVVWGTPANFNWFRVLAAKLCGIEQKAPPIFGRAAITLGIGPHSSLPSFRSLHCPVQCILFGTHCHDAYCLMAILSCLLNVIV